MDSVTQKQIIAHRGASSLAPENTMPAFYKAHAVGAHGVETDVSVSADGKLFLLHDETFRRTTNIARIDSARKNMPLHAFSWQEVERLDAGTWFVERDPFRTIANGHISSAEAEALRQTPIPLLEELLDFVKRNAWFVNIEIKRLPLEFSSFAIVEETLHLLGDMHFDPSLFSISSFHHPYLLKVLELWPEVEVNALIGENIFTPHDWGNYEFKIYNANVGLIDSLQIERAKRRGCRINLYTVNQLAEMQHYSAMGVEKIITDFPQLFTGRINE